MKFVALVSGGKDSIYNIVECIRNGHELVACVHIGPPPNKKKNNQPTSSSFLTTTTAAACTTQTRSITPPPSSPPNEEKQEPHQEEEESYMYQTAASEVLPILVEECLGVPLILYERKGRSVNTSLVYETPMAATTITTTEDSDATPSKSLLLDEVEDLYGALIVTRRQFPNVEAVASGAILSTYQRIRIEHVCNRLDLVSLSYLWRIDSQHNLLERMLLDGGIEAILVKTACPPGLVPSKHLNKSLGELYDSGLFHTLNKRYQFHMCGEGGEYESLVLDCPLYKKRLVLDDVDIVTTNDGVGVLVIKACHAQDKVNNGTGTAALPVVTRQQQQRQSKTQDVRVSRSSEQQAKAMDNEQAHEKQQLPMPTPKLQYLPRVRRMTGGLLHLSEIMSPVAAAAATTISSSSLDDDDESGTTEADLALQEALVVLHLLRLVLVRHGATPQDVLMVHLYLSEISHFALINTHYRDFFGTTLPPSRSCVAVGKDELPGGRRVSLDCMVQCGSGQYLRSSSKTTTGDDDPYAKAARLTTTSSLRQVLHVQSISYWAPVCVGPYSQANTLRSGIHLLAGQIGLVPATMKLRDTWTEQLEQCWTNVASVIDALDNGSLKNLLSCLVYVADQVYSQGDAWTTAESICRRNILNNARIVPGAIDSAQSTEALYGGYEDEETWKEMTKEEAIHDLSVPLLFVSIPEMPMGALVEVEAVCATQLAATCLELKSFSRTQDDVWSPLEIASVAGWDTGHDFALVHPALTRDISLNVSTRSMGHGCISFALVSSSIHECAAYDEVATSLDIENILNVMVDTAFQDDVLNVTGLSVNDTVHVRLYHNGAVLTDSEATGGGRHVIDDGIRLRTSLNAFLSSKFAASGIPSVANVAAASVVPVQAMKVVSPCPSSVVKGTTVLAMQVLVADPVHMENEMWIHHGREES